MKVLHVSGSKSWGGNEQQLVDLVTGLNNISITNLILCVPNSPLEKKAKKLNINHKLLANKKGVYFNYVKALYKVVQIFKPNIIHLHTSNSTTFYVIADVIFKLNTPTVFSKKGMRKKNSWLSKRKYNYKGINKIICVSKGVLNEFKSVIQPKNHHKLFVVYDGIKTNNLDYLNAVNLRKSLGLNENITLIGNIANHARAKDLVTLMNAFNILINSLKVTNVHLIQIGNKSDYTNEFLPLIKEYNLENNITLTGFVENPTNLLRQMDIYVMSSEREGLPLTIYEAFLNKVPVISTKAGGIPEAIKHEYNGLLSEVKDPLGLAENINNLIGNPENQKLFAERSYKLLFEKYTIEKCSENTLKVYKELLKNDF